jgi:hypothetical protein
MSPGIDHDVPRHRSRCPPDIDHDVPRHRSRCPPTSIAMSPGIDHDVLQHGARCPPASRTRARPRTSDPTRSRHRRGGRTWTTATRRSGSTRTPPGALCLDLLEIAGNARSRCGWCGECSLAASVEDGSKASQRWRQLAAQVQESKRHGTYVRGSALNFFVPFAAPSFTLSNHCARRIPSPRRAREGPESVS